MSERQPFIDESHLYADNATDELLQQVYDYIPDISEPDAERMHGLFAAASIERHASVGLAASLDYSITHPYRLATMLREAPPHVMRQAWVETTSIDTALPPSRPVWQTVTYGMLALAQTIDRSNMAHRISVRNDISAAARLAPLARKAVEADLDYRYIRSINAAASNEPIAFKRTQYSMFVSLARYAVSQTHSDQKNAGA